MFTDVATSSPHFLQENHERKSKTLPLSTVDGKSYKFQEAVTKQVETVKTFWRGHQKRSFFISISGEPLNLENVRQKGN